MIHNYVAPDLITPLVVTAISPAHPWPIGDFGGGRERPPFFASRIGTAGWADVHWCATPWEGRSRPKYPCGKAQTVAHKGER